MHGGKAAADEVLEAEVGHVEVGGVDAGVVLFPGESGFVGATGIEGGHIGRVPRSLRRNRATRRSAQGSAPLCLALGFPNT